MRSRFVISLEKEERQALYELARRNYREIREQLQYMIRKELEHRGFLGIQTHRLRGRKPRKVVENDQ